MALSVCPFTGELTTDHDIAEKVKEKQRRRQAADQDGQMLRDALTWRGLPEAVREQLKAKYNLAD